MSKIAELLKLAEKKKEDLKIELPAPVIPIIEDDTSRANQGQVDVSKSNYEQLGVNKCNDEGVEVSRGNNNINNSIFPKPIETSPARDYTKVSNSIMKRAIPEKYFRGLSKHTYDVLYQKTRGAIVPSRTIQLTKDELVRLTGISKDAIKLHIKYLKETGLLKSRPAIGSHAGWEYEIFVPEEIEETEQVGARQGKARQGKASENLPLHSGQNLPPLTHTNPIGNKETYDSAKTSYKDKEKNDDEPFGKMTETLAKAFEKVSGKTPQKSDAAKLNELAELLAMELEIAAARTKSISNVPAFLTEHLRRRLIGKISATETTSKKPKVGEVSKTGKSIGTETVEEYEAEPLSKEGRETVLKTMRQYLDKGQSEFIMSFQQTYTLEDWNWLMKELEKK